MKRENKMLTAINRMDDFIHGPQGTVNSLKTTTIKFNLSIQ
jgi:hypothetical protein